MTQFPKARPSKGAPAERKPRTYSTHVFIRGPHTTGGVKPESICETCGNVYGHPVHDLTRQVDDVSARILGEGTP